MRSLLALLLAFCTLSSSAQTDSRTEANSDVLHKYSFSFPYFIATDPIGDAWDDRQNTQMIELHVKRNLDNKNIVGLKFATWRLFQPMGITWWDGLLDKLESESEFYPGHVRETGLGVSYQRMLWKGLFASVEVLPQFQTYMDLDGNELGNDFKLYNSYHVGYHIAFGKSKRFFIEPQIHSQHWMFDDNAPDGFAELDDKWRNYFLFEPNIYVGMKF